MGFDKFGKSSKANPNDKNSFNLDQDSRRNQRANQREIFEQENHEKLKLKLKCLRQQAVGSRS